MLSAIAFALYLAASAGLLSYGLNSYVLIFLFSKKSKETLARQLLTELPHEFRLWQREDAHCAHDHDIVNVVFSFRYYGLDDRAVTERSLRTHVRVERSE